MYAYAADAEENRFGLAVRTGRGIALKDRAENDPCHVSQHEPKRSPHLPHHHQSSADIGRSTFGSVNGNRRALRTDTETQYKASNEQMPPSVGECLPQASQAGYNARDEDGTSPAQHPVQWFGQPVCCQFFRPLKLDE